jgi:hypothetical protein
MNNLIENILNGDYVSANELFESHMEEIAERKLFEAKRAYAAQMDEAMGGMSREDFERRKKAGFMKASDYFEALKAAKEIERKAKSDITPVVTKKKKISEANTGVGSGSQEELEKRAKKSAVALGQAIKGAAKAQSERVSREQAKRSAMKKSAAKSQAAPVPPLVPQKPISGTVPTIEPEIRVKKLAPKSAAKTPEDRQKQVAKIADMAKRLKTRGHSDPYGKLKQASPVGYQKHKIVTAIKDTGSAISKVKSALNNGPLGRFGSEMGTWEE